VPPGDLAAFEASLAELMRLGYPSVSMSDNPAYRLFL
jgi:hypothetical protein